MDILNPKQYIERFLKIKTKTNKITSMRLNEPQRRLYGIIAEQAKQNKPIRIIILKARQMGFSTLTEALIFHRTANFETVNSLIIAHKDDATTNLFRMSKLFYDNLPSLIRPMRQLSNAYELIFANPTRNMTEKERNPGLNSIIKCATAGGSGVGRSDTYTNVHASEVAFWTGDVKETLTGLMQAVPSTPGTMVVLESTANGFNYFKELWDAAVSGENDFVPVFFPWYELDEYQRPYDGSPLTEEEKELRRRYDLSLEQISWRRWCIKNNCGGDIDLFKQEYPSTPEEAFIATGACVFDKQKVINRINDLKGSRPIKEGLFLYDYDGLTLSNIRWQDKEKGYIKIYEEAKERCPYVLGGDTAGEGSDYFTAHVIDNTNGRQCAVFRDDRIDEDEYARQIYCLGMYYNTALIGLEANFSTFPIRELERLGYPKQFVREAADTFTGAIKKSYGFKTTSLTRPNIIANLVSIVRDEIYLINDIDTLREMLAFVKINGKPQAEAGQHDDLVMGLAITYGIRGQQDFEYKKLSAKREHWEDDQYTDYYNADEETRKELIRLWGNPF